MNLKCEDTIHSFFFSTKNYSSTEWDQLCHRINMTISFLSQDYIWHRNELKVVVPIAEEKNGTPPHLIGTACFGDNIEDEWFIVYILLEITKKHTDLIIQIGDNDGNFLLIEAADSLPSWANPDTTENRVFIYGSNIHIIPPNVAPIDSQLGLKDALIFIAEKTEETKAPPDIQRAILKRFSNYPKQIEENSHRAILKLPLEIAAVLTIKPSLISSLVNTYCSLDAYDAKNCNNIGLDDCIQVEIKFTKFLYAMLMHTRFPSGCRFKNLLNDKKTQLGLKLSCGYRIIMAKSCDDIFSTSEYNKFFNSLTKNGYFKENLQGSVEYKRLLDAAKLYFTHMECPVSTHAYNIINNIKLSNEFKEIMELLKCKSDENLLEDDDTWLNIHPDQLNEFLNEHYGRKVQIKNNDPITPHIITSELTNFLKETSDFEGVEENVENNIDFDSDDFVNCLEKMLNIISNNENSNTSDESDFSDDDTTTKNFEQDKELAAKLKTTYEHKENDEEIVLQNFIQSMKEEGLSGGPVSMVFRTIGVKKSDLIDSDDEDDDDDE